jgi:hypothetical protein
VVSVKIRSTSGDDLYVAENAADVRTALEEATKKGANLAGAYLAGANLTRANLAGANLARANGINPFRVNDLLMLREQPGPIRAYKLVDAEYRSPIQPHGKLAYTVGQTVSVVKVDLDEAVQCGAGINLATLPWCMREWHTGYHILVVEFTAADIVAIPIGDGKFRVRSCTVIRELDLAAIGLVPAAPAL